MSFTGVFANVLLTVIYLIPLVVALFVLREFFRMAKAVQALELAQKEQTELMRSPERIADDSTGRQHE